MKSLVSIIFFFFYIYNFTFAQKRFWSINAFVPVSFGYQEDLNSKNYSSGSAINMGGSIAFAQMMGKKNSLQEDFGIQSKSFPLKLSYPGFNFSSGIEIDYVSVFLGFTYNYELQPAFFLHSGMVLSRIQNIGYGYSTKFGTNHNLNLMEINPDPVWMPEIKEGVSYKMSTRINTGLFFQLSLKKAPTTIVRDFPNRVAQVSIEPYLYQIALNLNYKLTGVKKK